MTEHRRPTLTGRAWDLGASQARHSIHPWNMADESDLLMDALGELDPTTDDNMGDRIAACDAYEGGYRAGRHYPADMCAGCNWCADYRSAAERERIAMANENHGPDWSRVAVIAGRAGRAGH